MFTTIGGWIISIIVALIGSKQVIDLIKWVIDRKTTKSNKPFSITFENLSFLSDEVSNTFNTTSADRFLLLVANIENIKKPWVSCLYEQHKANNDGTKNISVGATSRYSKLDMDNEYYKMINEVKEKGSYKITVSKEPNSLLKGIYDYEGIKHSNLYYLYTFYDKISDNIFFCSIAKHGEEPFTYNENIQFDLLVNNLRHNLTNE